MAHRRCGEPACGRFVAAASTYCDIHTDNGDSDVLGEVFRAQRHVLKRLREEANLEMLSRCVPRVSSVTIQAIRTRHQIGAKDANAALALIQSISDELDEQSSLDSKPGKSPLPTGKDQP